MRVMKRVAEKSHEFNRDVYMIIVDFKAAYDSVKKKLPKSRSKW